MKIVRFLLPILFAVSAGSVCAEGPVDYPGQPAQRTDFGPTAKTRAQIHAELAEAQRLGLVVHGEINDRVATPDEERQIADAGERAVAARLAAH